MYPFLFKMKTEQQQRGAHFLRPFYVQVVRIRSGNKDGGREKRGREVVFHSSSTRPTIDNRQHQTPTQSTIDTNLLIHPKTSKRAFYLFFISCGLSFPYNGASNPFDNVYNGRNLAPQNRQNILKIINLNLLKIRRILGSALIGWKI